jgi:hypothetical protein
MKKRKRHSDRSGRDALQSPGRPAVAQREDRRRFWAAIAQGQSSEDAVSVAGVSPAVGTRWFREACHQRGLDHHRSRLRGGTCCSRSGRRLLSCGPRGMACGRSPAGWSGPHRPSPGNCGGMPPPAAVAWIIGRPVARRPLGAPAGQAGGQSGAAAIRAGSSGRHGHHPGRGGGPAVTWKGRRHGPRQDGPRRGARNRSLGACGSTIPRTRRCASAMRPSTRRCSSRAAEPCAAT